MIAAWAPPSVSPAATWSTVPAPPDAMTGTFTASATAAVTSRAYAAAHCDRDEHMPRHPTDRVEVDHAPLRTRGDVVEHDLVDLVVVEVSGELLGRADVDVVLELLGLRHPPADDVEAGDQPLRQHWGAHGANRRSNPSPTGPLFSAWHWVATM